MVQGCTFAQDNLHVQVGSNVVSAILTANQAAGGFRVENQAGKRAQIALNEEDPIEWTREAKLHYRLQVGGPGDGRYLQGWHGPERGERPFRWTFAESRLLLPVVPGKPYSITLEANVPKSAESADGGLYLDDKRIVLLSQSSTLTAALPPPSGDHLRLELRCRGWSPRQEIPGSQDARMLGLQVFTVTLRAEGAGDRVFHANTGHWLEEASSGRKSP
jgi:hypothetical protein